MSKSTFKQRVQQLGGRLFGFNPAVPQEAPRLRTQILTQHEAVDKLLGTLVNLRDVDETLTKAGIKRHHLRRLLTDDDVFQAFQTRFLDLVGTPLRFEPDNTPASLLLQKNFKGALLLDMMLGAWQAVEYGYSVMEAVYITDEDGQMAFHWVGAKPMQWFDPLPDGRLLYRPGNGGLNSGVHSGSQLNTGQWVVDQVYKFFLTTHMGSYEQPRGEALLSRLYWVWFLRTQGWQFWSQFLERWGRPLLVGQSTDTVAMLAALVEAQRNAALAVGPEDKVEAVGVTGSGEAFDRFESALVRRTAKLVLGQTMTSGTDGGSGNRALGQVHQLVREDIATADKLLVTGTLQRLANALLQLNGYAADEVVLSLSDNKGLEKERAERDKTLHAVGVRFTRDYFTDNYDLTEEDFELSSEREPIGNLPADPAQLTEDDDEEDGATFSKAVRLFARRRGAARFTQQQQKIEDIGTALGKLPPIEPEQIRAAVLAATDPQDLEQRLYMLCGARPDYTDILERALFTADVLGYVHAEGKI